MPSIAQITHAWGCLHAIRLRRVCSNFCVCLAAQEPWLQAALLLMAERAAGSTSELGPYIAAMPSQGVSPLNWSAEQQEQLAGTQAAATLQGYRCGMCATS